MTRLRDGKVNGFDVLGACHALTDDVVHIGTWERYTFADGSAVVRDSAPWGGWSIGHAGCWCHGHERMTTCATHGEGANNGK